MAKEFLDLSKPLFVKMNKIILEGKEFHQDDELPWKKLGISPKKVNQLYSMRYLTHQEPRQGELRQYGILIRKRTARGAWYDVLDNNFKALNRGALSKADAIEFWERTIDAIESGSDEGRAIASTFNYDETENDDTNQTKTDDDKKSGGILNGIKNIFAGDQKNQENTGESDENEETEETL